MFIVRYTNSMFVKFIESDHQILLAKTNPISKANYYYYTL